MNQPIQKTGTAPMWIAIGAGGYVKMTEEELERLATKVMEWTKYRQDRLRKPEYRYSLDGCDVMPVWKWQPHKRIEQAFMLLKGKQWDCGTAGDDRHYCEIYLEEDGKVFMCYRKSAVELELAICRAVLAAEGANASSNHS